MVVVDANGLVSCVGAGGGCSLPAGAAIHDVSGGSLLGMFVAVGQTLGLVEVDQEPELGDGAWGPVPPSWRDALRLQVADSAVAYHRHVRAAWAAGCVR